MAIFGKKNTSTTGTGSTATGSGKAVGGDGAGVNGMAEPTLMQSDPNYRTYANKEAAGLEAQRFKEATAEMANFVTVARAQKGFEEMRAKLYAELKELQALFVKAEISKDKFLAQLQVIKRKYGLHKASTNQAKMNANRAIDQRYKDMQQRAKERTGR